MSSGSDIRSGSLGRRLQAARETAFVGREEELAVFSAALHGGGCSVLYVHGPGGIGKSALLRRFAQEAAAAGRPVSLLDGRMLEPAASKAEPVIRDADAVLLVDDFEPLQGQEGWLRERFLPRLPMGALVVIAGRNPPDMRWRADPGWAGALEVLPLRGLRAGEARALMDSTGVPAEAREPLLAFAGGHPLALLLGAAVAVKDGGAGRRWTPHQDVVATLLDQLVGEAPSAAHRHALEICAHAYRTTEDLLRAVLPEEAGTLFRWLRRLPFVESSGLGLFPHDVVREVLEADLRWRDPEGYAVMRDRIHAHLAARVRTASDADVPGAVAALLYPHRGDRAPAGFHGRHDEGEFQEEVPREEDVGTLLRLAAEGTASAACAAFWAERQPEAFRLYRRAETGEPVAFSAWLRLAELDEEELTADPLVAEAWAHARATTPLRAGEHVAVSRVWALPPCRGSSPVMDVIQWRVIGDCLRSERMAWSYIEVRHPNHVWAERLRHYGMRDIAEQPRPGEEAYSLFAHDWRAVPAWAWLERMNRPLVAGPAGGPGAATAHLAVLSRAEFAQAVRKALRQLPRPDALAASPLTRTRLIAERAGQNPATALGDLLRQAIDDLREDPRSAKSHRALSVTFLRGTPTQELAAERLGLPFTTYRRHLAAGIERLCADLWHRELYGTTAPAHRPT
ncbi:ATP-binding protein [Nonomuraea jiangxiensis]|uniref:AAA ATPase domain-containing protein n=1 Tax=Nonomuraea jiangxiensis TaxID=633440 RepID=A0A1G8Q8T1_9ACTN|nr:ATP-binding protein [Nonomuraea jiangxiensis]SDJ01111.1 AAA ATPase domain-containing protein [Nonomuraea jiangxiensis]